MEVSFANSTLQKLCNSEKKLRGKYGPRMAALIQQRLLELVDAETLEDMRTLPGPNCHELTQNLRGLLAVNLVHPDRLAFKPGDTPVPRKPDGGLDWVRVTSVVVVGIGDYHGK
jgi:proteic killer suppression protein